MNVRLADINELSWFGTFAALVFCAVVVLVAVLLAALAFLVPTPEVLLARNASLVFGWAVVLVTMTLLTVLIYTEYLLLKGVLDR